MQQHQDGSLDIARDGENFDPIAHDDTLEPRVKVGKQRQHLLVMFAKQAVAHRDARATPYHSAMISAVRIAHTTTNAPITFQVSS